MQSLLEESQSLFTPDMKAGEVSNVVSWVITQKKSDSLSELRALSTHKSVAVRRKVVEAFRMLGTESDLAFLEQWKSKEGDRKAFVAIESAMDAIERRKSGDFTDFSSQVFTVKEALVQIKHVLGEKEYVIEAEISEAKNYYQMYYFTVKDAESEATLNCRAFQNVIFRSGFPLNEGLQVRISGKFVLDKYSRLLFDVKSIQLTGEGELLRNLKLLQEKLDKEGLLDESRKRKPAMLPNNILLLASSSSAAITDFTKVLGRRRGGMTVYHLPIKTQGVGAESEILARLKQAEEVIVDHAIDTVVITRGGGSKEDLIVFNSEPVVRAVHGISRPVIVAIGHERDVTLAELVADMRASTPSQAAELVSYSSSDVAAQKDRTVSAIHARLLEKVQQYRVYNERMVAVIREYFAQRVLQARQTIQSVNQSVYALIGSAKHQTQDLAQQCYRLVIQDIELSKRSLEEIKYLYPIYQRGVDNLLIQNSNLTHTIYQLIQQNLAQKKQEFLLNITTIQSIHPRNILKNGYAMVEANGKVITRKKDVVSPGNLQLSFYDGTLEVNT